MTSSAIPHVALPGMTSAGIEETMACTTTARDASISAIIRTNSFAFAPSAMSGYGIMSSPHYMTTVWQNYLKGGGEVDRSSSRVGCFGLVALWLTISIPLVFLAISLSSEISNADLVGLFAFIIGLGFAFGFVALAPALTLMEFRKFGFQKDRFLQYAAASAGTVWAISDEALLIAHTYLNSKSFVRTVFYDAIGSASVEVGATGLETLVVTARDGSHIASLCTPQSSTYGSPHQIALAINKARDEAIGKLRKAA